MGRWGCRGGQIFFKHGHIAYQIDRDDEQNRMQVKFLSYGQTGELGVRSKDQISFNFNYKVNFKDFYTKLCVCCTNETDRIFILSPWSCPRGGTLGRWGCSGGSKFFFKHGHVAYQIDRDDELNKMQVKFSS